LNLTGSTVNFDLKLAAVMQSRADIILLSDTRIITSKGISASQRIVNCLRDCKYRRYNAIFNSSRNSRGVAIFIAADLSFVVHREFRDALENYLIIDVEINKIRYGIGAIYGPNSTSREFFYGVCNCLRSLRAVGTSQFILGGDWNTTIDRNPVTSNIDTFYMSGLPNPVNSELLNRLCIEFKMLDPFRALYPTKRDYTYLPFGTVRLNRSRIDFFVVSASILNSVSECSINDSVSCKLFDHKQVNLLLNSPKTVHPTKIRLSNSYLKDECLSFSVDIAARRAHLHSFDCEMDNGINIGFRDRELTRTSEALNQYWGLLKIMETKAKQGINIELDEEILAYKQRLRMLFEDMAPLATLERMAKGCVHSIFFTALIGEVRNAGSRTQKYLSRLNKCYEQALSKNLLLLKDDYAGNREAIADIENILKIRSDNTLREKIKDIKIFECLNAEKATPLLLDLAKKSGAGESLDTIRDENGDAFESELERNSYILNYYTDLYKADVNVVGSIEDFLGPTICAKTTVRESKLTNYERSELDKQLDITVRDGHGGGWSRNINARYLHTLMVYL
jgi:exonuclease III